MNFGSILCLPSVTNKFHILLLLVIVYVQQYEIPRQSFDGTLEQAEHSREKGKVG